MKITNGLQGFGLTQWIRSKQDRTLPHDQSDKEHTKEQTDHHQGKRQSQNPQDNPEQKLDQAVEEFRSEAKALFSDLDVFKEGVGPGLKVILKNNLGGVVRTFTGEEFLRLRDISRQHGCKSAKILDHKL